MKTFVLCGGEGTRLRPYTYDTPKPMLLVAGKPILWYVIENLRNNGLTDLILTLGYKHEQISEYVGDGSKLNITAECSIEKEPLGTAGSVFPHKNKIKKTFVVVMGDHITNIDMKKMIESHKKSKAIATVAVKIHETHIDFGVTKIEKGRIIDFVEKPTIENYINTGIYIFEPEIFGYITERDDFAKNVFPRLLEQKKPINAYIMANHWFDIGRIEDYQKLDDEIKNNKLKL